MAVLLMEVSPQCEASGSLCVCSWKPRRVSSSFSRVKEQKSFLLLHSGIFLDGSSSSRGRYYLIKQCYPSLMKRGDPINLYAPPTTIQHQCPEHTHAEVFKLRLWSAEGATGERWSSALQMVDDLTRLKSFMVKNFRLNKCSLQPGEHPQIFMSTSWCEF